MAAWGVGVKSKAWEGRLSQTGALYRPQVVPTCVQRREGNANVLYRPPMAYCRVWAGDARPRHGRSSAAKDLANVAALAERDTQHCPWLWFRGRWIFSSISMCWRAAPRTSWFHPFETCWAANLAR